MRSYLLIILFVILAGLIKSQNLVVDGAISNSNANWGGHEAPWNGTTYQTSYMAACGNNYVMEVDAASTPSQVVSGFSPSQVYILTFKYAYRTAGCGPSNNPTFLRIRFSDATSTLDYTLSVPNTQTTFANFTYTFTNNASTTHTLAFTNPGNANTCGVIVDDISLMKLAGAGGVSTSSVSYWIKAESIGLPDGSNVYGWISHGTNVLSVTKCTNLPVYRTGLASVANNLVANYNPYLTFNGTNQYLEYTAARVDFMNNSAGGAGGSFFAVYAGGSTDRAYFGHRGNNNSRVWGKTDSLIYANTTAVGTNNNMRYAVGSRINLVASTGKSNGITIGDLNGVTQTLVNKSADVDYLTVGVRRNNAGAYSQYFNGSLSEVIVFNNILSETQMHQVRSYLAAKYGVTMSNNTGTGTVDERTYLATNGTTAYWDYSSNSAYHNNVTVIGRDDATALNQTISISTDADAGSNTGNSMLVVNNAAAISSDMSYLAVGHNGVAIPNPGGANFFDVPTGIQSRLNRIWKFQKTGTGIGNNVTLRFDMTGFSPLTGSDLRLLVSTSASFASANIIAGAYGAPYFTVSLPTTGGVFFTIGSINQTSTPLPVTLLDFTATLINKNKVFIEWSTASETNNDHFDVERTTDGLTFELVGKQKGKGNPNKKTEYGMYDNKPHKGKSYYRLKQVDANGKETLTPLVAVTIDEVEDELIYNVYPNPNTGEFTIEGDVRGAEVIICNVIGQKVEHTIKSQTSGSMQVDCSTLAKGVYFIQIKLGGETKTRKLVIE